MSRMQSVLWAAFAACWVIPILRLCQVIGGCQWIEHMGHTGSVATAVVMIGLCSLAAVSSALSGAVPNMLRYGLVVVSALHLFHSALFFCFISANGHVSPLVHFASLLLSVVFPSVIVTASVSIMVVLYVVLPLACLLLALLVKRTPTTASVSKELAAP